MGKAIAAAVVLVMVCSHAGFAGTSGSTASPVERLMTAAWVDHDVNMASETIVPGSLLHTPEGDFIGAEGTIRFVEGLRGYFQDLDLDVLHVDRRADFVTIQWMLTGIHTGGYQGLKANCSAIVVDGVAVFRIAAGMVHEQWYIYDRTAITRQIEAFNAISPDSRPGCAT